MAKIALISDTHQGARSGSSIFREYFRWWYANEFFPELKARGIDTIFHLGDFFDNRNSISLLDIDYVTNDFAGLLKAYGMDFIITVGNHDVAYKNTNKIHSLSMLKASARDNVKIVEEAQSVKIHGFEFIMVPWINPSNEADALAFIKNQKDKENKILLGHFSIQGIRMYKNSPPADHGIEQEFFKGYHDVWSGHFHHRSRSGNIMYLGSPFHLNWQDYNDERGYHIFDTETRELEYIENKTCLFREVTFEKEVFSKMTSEDYKDLFEGMFVRLVVQDKDYDRVALLDTISKINKSCPHDLQVDNTAIVTSVSNAPVDLSKVTTKDTLSYIVEYIESNCEEGKKASMIKTMTEVYQNAVALSQKGE